MLQTGSAKRVGSDAGNSAVTSNGPKQTSGPPIRDGTQVCFHKCLNCILSSSGGTAVLIDILLFLLCLCVMCYVVYHSCKCVIFRSVVIVVL